MTWYMNSVTKNICPVILAGGSGTRLWPLSRESYPKQFLSFNSEYSMLQQSLLRICNMKGVSIEALVLVCNDEHRFLVAEQSDQIKINPKEIITEPLGRNTAPALTIAALRSTDNDPILLMIPGDHLIQDTMAFHIALELGATEAASGKLVTFGIQPLSPETGYGYLQADSMLDNKSGYLVKRFVEKPDSETAVKYLKDGDYFWNSGIFMMKTSVWLEVIKEYRADIYTACCEVNEKSSLDGIFFKLDKSFSECPSDSIDYAVMEEVCEGDSLFQLAMVVMDAGWSDLGSWSSVWETSNKDKNQNAISGDVIVNDTKNSIIQSHSRLVVATGCDNLMIIETPDAVLIGNRQESQNIKDIVETLKHDDRQETVDHRRVHKPWGSYESLDSGAAFQVKRLTVNPGKKISLQLHHQRSEHWVVVQGVATVTCDEKIFDLEINQSTFIPLGAKHRLENRQETLLEVIEVQSGDYLGEDDIVRFDDDFGRHEPG